MTLDALALRGARWFRDLFRQQGSQGALTCPATQRIVIGSGLGVVMSWKWPSASKNGNSEEWTGFIDRGVTLEGTLQLKGTFRIDGNVKGNIISEQTVVLGEGAKVEGQIEGNRVVIAGRFDGVIFAKGRVEIEAKGVVTGEVHSPCMVIDPGGIFDGRCHMLASSDASAGVTIPIRAASSA
jgi:cytoskeletal protein CcmA (bactofilin family)